MCHQGYARANQTIPALRNLKWIADYLAKCHYSPSAYAVIVSGPLCMCQSVISVLYVECLLCHKGTALSLCTSQIGDATIDHENWQRPEEMTYERPVLSLDANHTGVFPLLPHKLRGGRLAFSVMPAAAMTTEHAHLLCCRSILPWRVCQRSP